MVSIKNPQFELVYQMFKCSLPPFFTSCLTWSICVISLTRPSDRLQAGDWPGLLGPERNGHSQDDPLPTTLASERLLPKWKLPAGEGYAGAAIAQGQVILHDRDGNQERVRCVKLDTGALIWEQKFDSAYRGGIDSDKGPRCVPTIVQDRIVACSAAGELLSMKLDSGEIVWHRALNREFQAEEGYFGVGSTPLVWDDRIIVNVGGKKGGVVAIALSDGKTIWTATDYAASYASPILFPETTIQANYAMIVVPTRLKTIGIDSQSGKLLWETNFGQRGPTVNAATPIAFASKLFLTASYGIGNRCLRPSNDSSSADLVYEGESLSSQYASPIYLNGRIYGSDGREDMGASRYRCLDAESGKVLWEKPSMPICHSVGLQSSQLLLIGIDGQLWLLNTKANQFESHWKTSIGQGVFRALPALSKHRLIVRSTSPKGEWTCFDLLTR
jgi:outer membrane protein assembly factor BamB